MAFQCLDKGRLQLTLEEVTRLRTGALQAVEALKAAKARIPPNDFMNLVNQYQYIITMYNNMVNTLQYQQTNPTQPCGPFGPGDLQQKLVYGRDGTTTTIVRERDLYSGAEWEEQFRANVHNPPSYMMPPRNVWDLQQLKNLHI